MLRNAETVPPSGLVLIVDDDEDVREVIRTALTRAGFETAEATTSETAMRIVTERRPVVVTLDVNLGEESGYDLCNAIREVSSVPVVFLTARQDSFDHALGLELGADSFLTKPFSPRVMVAQVIAAARRAPAPAASSPLLNTGLLCLDQTARRVTVGASPVDLTKTEFDLLAALMAEPDRAFEYRQLLSQVWGTDFGDTHTVEVTMGRLRRKLSGAGVADVVETIRGVGYRFARQP